MAAPIRNSIGAEQRRILRPATAHKAETDSITSYAATNTPFLCPSGFVKNDAATAVVVLVRLSVVRIERLGCRCWSKGQPLVGGIA